MFKAIQMLLLYSQVSHQLINTISFIFKRMKDSTHRKASERSETAKVMMCMTGLHTRQVSFTNTIAITKFQKCITLKNRKPVTFLPVDT